MKRANRSSPRPLTNDDGEMRELTKDDLAQFVPVSALPTKFQALFSEPKRVLPYAEGPQTRQPAV